jgi:hypothetical protein
MPDLIYESRSGTQRWLTEQRIYQRIVNSSIVEERAFTADDDVWLEIVANAAAGGSGDLLARARTALTNDRGYLDKVQAGTATQQDHAQQVAALTRQIQALIVYVVLGSD